jgi:mono/diheme cytochrome c family protein
MASDDENARHRIPHNCKKLANREELVMLRFSKKRVICAAAAVLFTGMSFSIYVAAEPGASGRPRPVVVGSTASPKVDRAAIDRGRYLVKTAGCNDCHTAGYAAAAGNVGESMWLLGDNVGWEGPWGTTYPINLRLFMESITAEQWLQIARTPARPPMPWFALRDMTDDDLLAIYHYARSLGAAGKHAPSYVPPGQTAKTPVIKFPAG